MLETGYKTVSLAWYRLDPKLRQILLTYWVNPKHELSYSVWNFQLIEQIQF